MTPGVVLAGAGLVLGLVLLWRGLEGYRLGARVADVSTSRIGSLAAGEVRVHGRVEPAEVLLVSPFTSTPCVWYRARLERRSNADDGVDTDEEERGVGFRISDESGAIRVFPRDAVVDVPAVFDASTGLLGETPVGLQLRAGSAFAPLPDAQLDRERAVAALLTAAAREPAGTLAGFGRVDERRGRWVEARLEPGDEVTVVGTAVPFGQLADPAEADLAHVTGAAAIAPDDEETAASIAAARAAGILVPPDEAWGNTAIPGFGIGMPVRAPELDRRATAPPLATEPVAERFASTFDLAPDLLVLAAGPESPLIIAAGSPGSAVARQDARFLVGLGGGLLAIGSAVVLALVVSGRIAA